MHRFGHRVAEHRDGPVQALDPFEVQLPGEHRQEFVGRRRFDRCVGSCGAALDDHEVLDPPGGDLHAESTRAAFEDLEDGGAHLLDSWPVNRAERHLVEQPGDTVSERHRQAVVEGDPCGREDRRFAEPQHASDATARLVVGGTALVTEDRQGGV